MRDYGDQKEQEASAELFDGPEPPPRGTLAWRRLVLEICATPDHDSYEAAMGPLWQWRGWRLGVDIMTEMLTALNRMLPPGHELRDGFGHLRLDKMLELYSEAERLSRAVELAQDYKGPLPAHEAMAQAVADSHLFGDLIAELVPVWQAALAVMGPPDFDQQAGAAVIIRYLNTTGERAGRSATMALVLHGTLREVAFPRGNQWIDAFLRDGPPPAVPASAAMSGRAGEDALTASLMGQLARSWEVPPRRAGAGGRAARRAAVCDNCGTRHAR